MLETRNIHMYESDVYASAYYLMYQSFVIVRTGILALLLSTYLNIDFVFAAYLETHCNITS